MSKENSDRSCETGSSRKTNTVELANELLHAVLNNDTVDISAIIKDNEYLLNYIYPEKTKKILLIACSEDGVNTETVSTLLDLKANPRDFSKDDGWEALHWAACKVNYNILKVLLEWTPEIISAVDNNDNNALHILIRFGNLKSPDVQKCIELLMEKGVDVNHGNCKNMTPIHWAKKKKLSTDIIELMENQTSKNNQEVNDGRTLMEYLKQDNVDQFINFKDGNIEEFVDYKEESHTLLQMCCIKSLTTAAIHLLNKGAKHEEISRKNSSKPITIAADKGNKDLVEALLDKYSQISTIPEELLPTVVKYIDREHHDNIGCYKVIIEKMKKTKRTDPDEVSFKLNEGDKNGNTALHYAVLYAEPDIIEELLSLGASLGVKNKSGVMPIENIEVEVLKTHLDNCVVFDPKKRKTDREEFTIKFNYRTLIPPYVQFNRTQGTFNVDSEAPKIQRKVGTKMVAETEVIDSMSQTAELKELLTHPTITSFLYLKWLQIERFFWINFVFYVLFVASLLGYIFIQYEHSSSENSSSHNISAQCLQIIFIVGWSTLMLRELFQVFVAPTKYFMNFENYIEVSLLIISAMIAFNAVSLNDTRKELSALAILLVSFELILMLGQHPKFSTNVVMFRTVSCNFYKFLFWYSLPIIAFSVSFHLVFATNNNSNNSTDSSNDNDYATSFNNPLHSVFKTMIMLTGEFDSGSINFDTFPLSSKLIFAGFVFTIAIILLNLLNGLAVSDTQMIQNHAELIGYITRAQFIANIESMLIGNIFVVKYTQKLINMCCPLTIPRDWNDKLGQFLAQIVCIFPKYFDYEMTFYPRKDGLIEHTENRNGHFVNVHLDRQTILRTNNIIQEKRDEMLKNQDDSIKRIEYAQDFLKSKIEAILELVRSRDDN